MATTHGGCVNIPDLDTVLADMGRLDAEGRAAVAAAHRNRRSGADARTEASEAAVSALIVAGHIRTWLTVTADVRKAVDSYGPPTSVAEAVVFAQVETVATEAAIAAAAARLAGGRVPRSALRVLLEAWPARSALADAA